MKKIIIPAIILIISAILNSAAFADSVSTDLAVKPISTFNSFKADSSMGSAVYNVPIEIPPGRKGVQPQISLHYSSSQPNGWIGVGWNLNFGYIERSKKEGIPKYTDKDTFYISFSGINSDLVSAGDNVYWPKITPIFLKLIFDGSFWKAYDKNGMTYYFGQNHEARIADTVGTARWYLEKIVDSCGNYTRLSYQKIEGQVYLSGIEYTGNETANELPFNKIDFLLEDRDDWSPDYSAGFKVTATKRLKQIEIKTGRQLSRRYVLDYKYSRITGRSLLISVTAYGNDDLSFLPAQVFTYQEENPEYTIHMNDTPSGDNKWNVRHARMDKTVFIDSANGVLYPDGHFSSFRYPSIWWKYVGLSGKGKWHWPDTDLGELVIDEKSSFSINMDEATAMYYSTYLYVNSPKTIVIPAEGNCNAKYFLNSDYEHPYDFSTPLNLQAGYNLIEITGYNLEGRVIFNLNFSVIDNVDMMNSFPKILPYLSGDFNGDGKSDLATYEGNSVKVAVSSGENFIPKVSWGWLGLSGVGYGAIPFMGDFNGDGRSDIGIFARDGSDDFWVITTSNGKELVGGSLMGRVGNASKYDLPAIGDFDGDRITERGYYGEKTGNWYVEKSEALISGFGGSGWSMHLGDFNGDGLTDIAVSNANGDWKVAFCDGIQFIDQGFWINGFANDKIVFTADFNYDGMCDIGYFDKNQGKIIYRVSTGRNFESNDSELISGLGFSGQLNASMQLGDFNGDGLLDPYIFNASSGAYEIAYSRGQPPDLLIKVENGLGSSFSLEYVPSTKFSNTYLPIAMPLLVKTTLDDGAGNSYVNYYEYSGGFYDKTTKEFRGFNRVAVTDNDGNITETYFLQGTGFLKEYEKFLPYKIILKDNTGKIYRKTDQEWSYMCITVGTYLLYISEKSIYYYKEDGSPIKICSSYKYDNYGNVTLARELSGEEVIGGKTIYSPSKYIVTEYVYSISADWPIYTLPSLTYVQERLAI